MAPKKEKTVVKRVIEPEPEKVSQKAEKASKVVKSAGAASSSSVDFEVSWDNFHLIKQHFKLNDRETEQVLLSAVGPCKKSDGYWTKMKQAQHANEPVAKKSKGDTKVALVPETEKACEKGDGVEVESATPAPKKRAAGKKDSLEAPPKKAKGGSEVPAEKPQPVVTAPVHKRLRKPAEEIMPDTELDDATQVYEAEPFDEDEDGEVEESVTSGGDDPESPAPPVTAAIGETEVVKPDPPRQGEPLIAPVAMPDDPAQLASASLEANLEAVMDAMVDDAVKKVPTPAKSQKSHAKAGF